MESRAKDKEIKKRWSLRNLHFKFGSRRSSDEEGLYSSPNSADRKAKSSIDLRSSSNDSQISPPPPTSKRRFWSSFRRKRKSRDRFKNNTDKSDIRELSASQPNIVDHNRYSDRPMFDEMEPIFISTDITNTEESSPDRSLSDPSISPIKPDLAQSSTPYNSSLQRHRSQSHSADELEREDEGDSGIAVIESTQCSGVSYQDLTFCR